MRSLSHPLSLAHLVATLGLGALFVGCGGSASEPTESLGSTEQAIQDGQVTGDQYPFAVALAADYQGQLEVFCSGTLIAPNLVLTARHCISQLNTGEAIDCRQSRFQSSTLMPESVIRVSTDPRPGRSSVAYEVDEIILPTDNRACGNDIALMILADNIPASEATPAIPFVQSTLAASSAPLRFTAIGYGNTSMAGGTSGTRRIRQNIDIICAYGNPSRNCTQYSSQGIDQMLDQKDFISTEGTCQGDSGSGAFAQTEFNADRYVTLGVLSRGGADYQDQSRCGEAIYTRVDSWRELIVDAAKQAAQAGGYTAPFWIEPGAVEPEPEPVELAELGETCGSDPDCNSGVCVKFNDTEGFVCSSECDDDSACESGYSCRDNYCGVTIEEETSSRRNTKSDSSGCSMSADPTKPIPWRQAAPLLALGVCLMAVRRRRH